MRYPVCSNNLGSGCPAVASEAGSIEARSASAATMAATLRRDGTCITILLPTDRHRRYLTRVRELVATAADTRRRSRGPARSPRQRLPPLCRTDQDVPREYRRG